MIRLPPTSTLFPYTTLFRSSAFSTPAIKILPYIPLGDGNGNFADANQRNRIGRSEEHTSELQSHSDLVCRLLLEKKKKKSQNENSRRRINRAEILRSNHKHL